MEKLKGIFLIFYFPDFDFGKVKSSLAFGREIGVRVRGFEIEVEEQKGKRIKGNKGFCFLTFLRF